MSSSEPDSETSSPSLAELQHYLSVATAAAHLGGELLMTHRGALSQIRVKSASGDLVTEADLASEKAILNHFKTALPDHAILAEESGAHRVTTDTPSDYLWAIDPLDGTLNYAHGLPFFCVSIGLLVQGKPRVGVVYAPALGHLYTGIVAPHKEPSPGLDPLEPLALCNGQALSVSVADTLKESLLATGFPYHRSELSDNNYAEFMYFADRTQDIRRPGSAALDLCFVASGCYEGYWEQYLNAWDVVAGAAIVEAAGGHISAYDGGPLDPHSGAVVASNGHIHPLLIDGLKRVAGVNAHGNAL
jgi:myo-inositol-1(or 4)-monophosphatase